MTVASTRVDFDVAGFRGPAGCRDLAASRRMLVLALES